MAEEIKIGGVFNSKVIFYFKENFKFTPDRSKREVNFFKDTPYLVTSDYDCKRISKMGIDLFSWSTVMVHEDKYYQVSSDELNSMVKYLDYVYPENLSGKIDNNLKLSAIFNIRDDSVFNTLEKFENNIVSVSKSDDSYIKLLLMFKKGTHLNIDIDSLIITRINGDRLENTIPIDRHSMGGNSFNDLIKSFRSTYKIDSNKDYIIK